MRVSLVMLLSFLLLIVDAAELVDVKQEIIGDVHAFKPQFNLPISDKVVEAIDNGIVITFVMQANLFKSVDWWFDESLESKIKTFQVRFFSLSSLYQLHNTRTDEKLSFVSLDDLLNYLGNEIVFEFKSNESSSYFETRVFLDKQALPSIMQLPNVFNQDWNFNSRWQTVETVSKPDPNS